MFFVTLDHPPSSLKRSHEMSRRYAGGLRGLYVEPVHVLWGIDCFDCNLVNE